MNLELFGKRIIIERVSHISNKRLSSHDHLALSTLHYEKRLSIRVEDAPKQRAPTNPLKDQELEEFLEKWGKR